MSSLYQLLTAIYVRDDSGRVDSEGDDIELGKGGTLRRFRLRRKSGVNMRLAHAFGLQNHNAKVRKALLWIVPMLLGLMAVLGIFELARQGLGHSGHSSNQAVTIEPRSMPVDPYSKLHNLIMVAGHAVYTSIDCASARGEDSWFLEDYQKHPGQADSFVEHIRGGVRAAGADKNALLLFSGGQTRKEAGPRSEATSYWSVAESSSWFGQADVRWRSLTEEHARDSFENLLFSICRFREVTGKYPYNITVVSYDFKEQRFAELHRSAIAFPPSRFHYIGTPPAPFAVKGAIEGEAKTRLMFQADPYGCKGVLHEKKEHRDPFARTLPYPMGCPELSSLFRYCGPGLYPQKLPWD